MGCSFRNGTAGYSFLGKGGSTDERAQICPGVILGGCLGEYGLGDHATGPTKPETRHEGRWARNQKCCQRYWQGYEENSEEDRSCGEAYDQESCQQDS